jgi:hypothetical protein
VKENRCCERTVVASAPLLRAHHCYERTIVSKRERGKFFKKLR